MTPMSAANIRVMHAVSCLRTRLRSVIYRCGWCGRPTNSDGNVLDVDPGVYMANHADAMTVNVNGKCCPYGDGSHIDDREPNGE